MRKVLVVVLFVSLIVPITLLGQFYNPIFDFEPEVVDAKGAALGRTTVLTTSGSNAIFTNPASLGMLEGQVLQGGMRFFFGSRKIEYDQQGVDDQEASLPFHMKFNHASFAMPFQFEGSPVKTVFAAGYRTYYDYGYNYFEEDKDLDEEYTRKSHGGLNTLTFGGALNFNDKLYAGLAINIGIMSKTSWEEEYKDDYGTEKEDGDGSVKGSFFTLGGIYQASPKMALGFMYRPGFEAKFEEESDYGDYDWDVTIPSLFALSAEYKMSETFMVVFEYQTRGLGDYEDEDNDMYGDSDNGSSIRIGSEIGGAAPFRFGFFMNSIPLWDIKNNGEYDEAPKSLTGFTGGISLPVSPKMDLDLFGEYAFFSVEDKYDEVTYKANSFKFGTTFTYWMK